jgi:hypothetical protein
VPYAPTSIAETSTVPRREGSQGTAPANMVPESLRPARGLFQSLTTRARLFS